MFIWLNDNLFDLSLCIFKKKFPTIDKGETKIDNYLIPKKGKGLLSKNAKNGVVPVIAGGLTPSTYHNVSNTKAPVVTISASGANAGYINLWTEPVWSSDSSYIDSTISNNVYFWYILLKKRQQEIFDSQTGSAQPHIYPKNIGNLPIEYLKQSQIEDFNSLVSSLFDTYSKNIKEIRILDNLKKELLNNLMG